MLYKPNCFTTLIYFHVCARGGTCGTWRHVWHGAWRHVWHMEARVAVRGQLSAVSSLFPPCGYQGWNLGLQAWQASVFTHCTIPTIPKTTYSRTEQK